MSAAEKAAFFRDLCTVCLVWPDTVAINRNILFHTISLRSIDHRKNACLRNLRQALENHTDVSTFVGKLELFELTDDLLSESPPSIPTSSRSLFLSFLSFIPKMFNLRRLCLTMMCCREDTPTNFCIDLYVLKESSVTHLTLTTCNFSISALATFLGYWDDTGLIESALTVYPSFRITPARRVFSKET